MRYIKTVGIALLVVGIIIFLVSVLADPLGIGEGEKFGSDQVTGTIVGAAVAVVGLVGWFLARRQ